MGAETRALTVETISEDEFRRLCEDIYRDRSTIYGFRPDARRGEALLWMLLGCLISLLSLSDAELQTLLADASGADPYNDAVCALLQARARPGFDCRPHVERLRQRAESDAG
jgi:hypothetical protein